jgi:hypothetical protein
VPDQQVVNENAMVEVENDVYGDDEEVVEVSLGTVNLEA